MQDQEKLREIESMGEDGGDFPEDEEYEKYEESLKESGGWGGIPLFQAVICALIILALIFFRVSDGTKYQEIAAWYQQEMAKEIELPAFSRAAPEPSASPEPTATPAPPVSGGAPPQML